MPSAVSSRVRAQYEALPYPAYGLLLPLRGQEAYASHSLFAGRLLDQYGARAPLGAADTPTVLLAGCGDVFPYLATFWEPRRHRLIALDLSARSLRRARLRCLPRLRPMEWRHGDLADADSPLPKGVSHIDCYGVLHHLERPAEALARLGEALAPGGTLRLMVYNSAARGWIRHLQRAFALLGLDGLIAEDRERGRDLLEELAAASPCLRERLAPMRGDLSHPARLVDTFFHAREARLSLGYWHRAIAAAGLRIIGLYDRYGELDDLPNPLLAPPSEAAWSERIRDRRFENNLELFLARLPAGSAPGARPPLRPRAGNRPRPGTAALVPFPAFAAPVLVRLQGNLRVTLGRAPRGLAAFPGQRLGTPVPRRCLGRPDAAAGLPALGAPGGDPAGRMREPRTPGPSAGPVGNRDGAAGFPGARGFAVPCGLAGARRSPLARAARRGTPGRTCHGAIGRGPKAVNRKRSGPTVRPTSLKGIRYRTRGPRRNTFRFST